MDVTAVVTTTGGPWLAEQLTALAGQTRPPDQIVLVNNGPAGAVDHVVERLRPRLPTLEFVEDRGESICGYARNAGAARARHSGLLFLDDDDVADAGYVEAMSRALDDADLVAARIDVAHLNRAALLARWGDMQSTGPMSYHDFLPWVIGGAMGVRREAFDRVGGFDTTFVVAEDTDLSWRVQLDAQGGIGYAPDARLHYRLRTDLRSAFRQARRWARWDAVLLARYRGRGMPEPGRAHRALRRWARPVAVAAAARSRDDLVVAARLLGACVGRAQGAVRDAGAARAVVAG